MTTKGGSGGWLKQVARRLNWHKAERKSCAKCGSSSDAEARLCSACGARFPHQDARYDGFISYRRDGGSHVASLLQLLLERDHEKRFYLDVEELQVGRFDEQLLERIQSTSNFVLVLTARCLDRCTEKHDWLKREILHAITTGRNIIPVLVEDFRFPGDEVFKDLPDSMRLLPNLQGVPYTHIYRDAAVRKITQYLRDVAPFDALGSDPTATGRTTGGGSQSGPPLDNTPVTAATAGAMPASVGGSDPSPRKTPNPTIQGRNPDTVPPEFPVEQRTIASPATRSSSIDVEGVPPPAVPTMLTPEAARARVRADSWLLQVQSDLASIDHSEHEPSLGAARISGLRTVSDHDASGAEPRFGYATIARSSVKDIGGAPEPRFGFASVQRRDALRVAETPNDPRFGSLCVHLLSDQK